MHRKISYVLNLVLMFCVGILGTLLYMNLGTNNTGEVAEQVVKNVTITETNTISEAIDKVYDSVVVVEVTTRNGIGTGSGFVYKKDDTTGYIITNHHVVDGAISVSIINSAGIRCEAKVLGSDEYSDIAVLSIGVDSVVSVAQIGDSTDVKLGDTVFTVGSPLGSKYQGTVTKGIISGKDRQVTVSLTNGSFVMDVLQIDAAINPGNSGGPLVNMNGEVIGVNSLKLVQDEVEGMGFAIPVELVMTSVEKLEKGEKIERPQLGVQMIDVSDNSYLLSRYQVNLDNSITSGVVILSVENGKPAANAGLEKGDVIISVNGTSVTNSAHFKYMLYKYEVGESIVVEYIRDGKKKEATIELTIGLE